jgi:hypothetical protein
MRVRERQHNRCAATRHLHCLRNRYLGTSALIIILSTRKDALFEWTGLSPPLPRGAGCGGQELLCTVNASSTGCYDDSATRGLGT